MLAFSPGQGAGLVWAGAWRKHGSCSGLDAQGYFAEALEAFELIKGFDHLPVADRNGGGAKPWPSPFEGPSTVEVGGGLLAAQNSKG